MRRHVLRLFVSVACVAALAAAESAPPIPPLTADLSGQLSLPKIPGLPPLAWRVLATQPWWQHRRPRLPLVLLLSLGVLGEYIGRIFAEVKRRPLYLIGHRFGIDDPDDSVTPPPLNHQQK